MHKGVSFALASVGVKLDPALISAALPARVMFLYGEADSDSLLYVGDRTRLGEDVGEFLFRYIAKQVSMYTYIQSSGCEVKGGVVS